MTDTGAAILNTNTARTLYSVAIETPFTFAESPGKAAIQTWDGMEHLAFESEAMTERDSLCCGTERAKSLGQRIIFLVLNLDIGDFRCQVGHFAFE